LDGSIRTVVVAVDNFKFEPFFAGHRFDASSQTILRLTAAGRPQRGLSYEVHLVQAYTFSSARGGGGAGWFGAAAGRARYRFVGLSRDWYQDRDHLATLWFDRLNLKIALAFADLTVGRQAITFGKAYFWNPLDVFLPFDPRQFDRDYKAGVDAVRLDIALGRFSGINLIAAFGRELNVWGTYVAGDQDLRASWYGSALLARAFTTVRNWDLAVQGGKIYGGYQLGGALVGEVWTVQLRAEAAVFWADEPRPLPAPFTGDLLEDHVTAVIGLGRRFEGSLHVEGEYLYNGSGRPGDLTTALARVAGGGSFHLGRHLLGLTLSYDILPILTGRLAVLYSLSDSSIQIQPILTWSVSDNASLILGVALNRGRRPQTGPGGMIRIRSEFGAYPDYYYLQFKFYF
ncbi:MAG: hypothetical protein KJ621_01350, partial [Proteobacteria bacterium]|nr:hypothetical protein [Pseudomonadota bacterium]